MTERRPIFVMGAERSGTTLLRLILDVHPNIAIGPESGFLRAVQDTMTIPSWNFGENWFERFGVERHEMAGWLADLYDGMFSRYAAEHGKERWGDKTPLHRWLADLADELFPESQFIGIVRHPGATCLSRARWGYEHEANAKAWNLAAHLLTADRDRLGPERYRILRYEDLLRDPEPVLRDLMDFLGEPWSDRLLRHHEIHAEREGPEVTDGGTRTSRPIDPSAIDAWRHEADPDEVAVIADATSPWRERFGYGPAEVLPSAEAPALRYRGVAGIPPAPVLRPREDVLAGRISTLEEEVDELEAEVDDLGAELEQERERVAELQRVVDRRFVRVGRLFLDAGTPRDLIDPSRWRRALGRR